MGGNHDPCDCIFCEDAEDRYYFGTLPFDVCKTCFNRKVIELRGYLKNASNRGESGKLYILVYIYIHVYLSCI